MEGIYLIDYCVNGIKNLDTLVRLSFYKKSISKDFSVSGYNVKGIYGQNGSGKSAIIESIRILKSIITGSTYLNNPLAQKRLNELINKKTEVLSIQTQYLVKNEGELRLFEYRTKLAQNSSGKFSIFEESLSFRNAISHKTDFKKVFEVKKGDLILFEDSESSSKVIDATKNLLSNASFTSVYLEKFILENRIKEVSAALSRDVIMHYMFGRSLYAYMDREDDHTDYLINEAIMHTDNIIDDSVIENLAKQKIMLSRMEPSELNAGRMQVYKDQMETFEAEVQQLHEFLKVFKNDLKNIGIEKTEDRDFWQCNLIMQYENYSVNAEFESTGVKKLIRLFTYIKKMINGDIVFIDELDSNLHDVYLCALLEYLQEYGKGQLCFTSHNIGPMDVLKKNKKSIDFLSVNHNIYSWKNNGNYSPSKLYRSGMIEGSPFNVDSIDFIGVFQAEKED